MKLLPLLCIILMACEPRFDLNDYIDANCIGGADYTYQIDDSCVPDWIVESIVDSVDYANETVDAGIQICNTGSVIFCDMAPAPVMDDHTVGWCHSNGDIDIWPMRAITTMHLTKVLRHEIGHLLGAGHSDDNKDVMATGWHGVTEYTKNDMEAMKWKLKSLIE